MYYLYKGPSPTHKLLGVGYSHWSKQEKGGGVSRFIKKNINRLPMCNLKHIYTFKYTI